MNEANESNLKLIHRFVEQCWNGGNLAAVAELIAEDCVYHDSAFPHLAPGIQSMQRHIDRCRRAFPDLKFANVNAEAGGDTVTLHWIASATQAAEFLGMPSEDKRASTTGTSVYRIANGKIVENWVAWDLMSLMAQLGAGKTSEDGAERRHQTGSEQKQL